MSNTGTTTNALDILRGELEKAKHSDEVRVMRAVDTLADLELVNLLPDYDQQNITVISSPSFNALPQAARDHIIDGMHAALDLLRKPVSKR